MTKSFYRVSLTERAARAVILIAMLAAAPLYAQIQFEDVTSTSGINHVGESYGASVGYANDDVLPDIFVSRHRDDPALLINLADGTFENRNYEIDIWQTISRVDMHGGSFADFDNDGDQDLTITAGSKNFSQFLVNNGVIYSDEVSNYSWDKRSWGGRLPVWFDFTRDGVLDVAFAIQGQRFQLFEQTGGDFVKRNFDSGNLCENNDYGHLSDLTFDGIFEWICTSQPQFPQFIYDYSAGVPFVDRSSLVPPVSNVVDSVVADFDGDLVPEFFALRGRTRVKGAEIVGPNSIEAHLIDQNTSDTTVSFQTSGEVTFEIHWNARNIRDVYIGAGAYNPQAPAEGLPISFTLSPSDPANHGMPPFDPATDNGIFVGYDPATQTWTLDHASGLKANSYVYAYIDSTTAVSNLDVQGLLVLDRPRRPVMLRYQQSSGEWRNVTDQTGLDTGLLCLAAVAADFDNDMDLDLYFVCRNAVSNRKNMLFVNDGTGTFTLAADAGGAAGPVGSGKGLGEGVVTTDYDVDGYVDLFVTNGLKLFPEAPYVDGGPDTLFRNQGGRNRWVEFDLEGTTSNRNGVGATVTVTAGSKQQRREQNGGYRRWAQNDQRLHFGLARNETFNVEILWPSGQFDTYSGLAANNLYTLVEGSPTPPEPETIPRSTPPSSCEDTGGVPDYDPAIDADLFVWTEDCGTSRWKVRATGGTEFATTYAGRIVSDVPFVNVGTVNLESNDHVMVDATGRSVSYSLSASGGEQDGINLIVAEGASVCFGVDSNVPSALAGASRVPFSLPGELANLGPCTQIESEISVRDARAIESSPAGQLVFELTLSVPSPNRITVDYETADGSAVAPGDYTAVSGRAQFAPGETFTTVVVPISDDSLVELGEEMFLNLSNPTNATIFRGQATGTIDDDDAGPCGAPPIDRFVDNEIFVWQNCTTGTWSLRVTAGGIATNFRGAVQGEGPLGNVTPVSIEDNDVLDTSDPTTAEFSLIVGNAGQDGFDFEFDPDVFACLFVDSPDKPVLVGAQRNPIMPPFDLTTSGTCFPDKADLVTTKVLSSSNPTPEVGEEVEFSISVLNAGPSSATGVTLTDVMPAGLTLVGFAATQGVFNVATGQWSVGGVDAARTETLTLWATVDNDQLGKTITNRTTRATSAQIDQSNIGDELEASVQVLASPSFTADLVTELSLTSGDFGPLEGDTVTYEISVTNTGPATATNVALSSPLPEGLILTDSSTSTGNFDTATGDWQIGDLTNGESAMLSLEARVDAGQTGNDIVYQTSAAGSDLFDPASAGDILASTISIGLQITPLVDWFGATGGVSAAGNRISYSGSPEGWNANTINSVALNSLGFNNDFELRINVSGNPAGTDWIMGLGIDELSASQADVDFGLRSSNGQLNVRENGAWVSGGPTLVAGDRVSIYVNDGVIEYRLNGVAITSSVYAGTPTFYVDSSFRSGAIDLDVVIAGEPDPVTPPTGVPIDEWSGPLGGVSATDNDLSYSGSPVGWNNNTINSAVLANFGAGGNYTMRFTVTSDPSATIWSVGLGETETTADRADIDYAFQVTNGALSIRENGVWVANGGAINAGDELAIEVAGTALLYRVNGIVVASSTISGLERFYVDTSFRSGAISLSDFTVEIP